MLADDVTLNPNTEPMPAAVARPSTPRGGVVVLHEAFGVTPHIRSICERLADGGYLAIAPALYHRDGAPVLEYDNLDAAWPLMANLAVDGIDDDVAASIQFLRDSGLRDSQIGVVGFCLGGSIALHAATRFELGGAVTFYGGGVSEERFGIPPLADIAPLIACPWLGLFGEQDHTIPASDIVALRDAIVRSPAQTELVSYPDAGHAFNCDDRPTYVASAANDAWQRTLKLLDSSLT